jgi:hypothetical protein
MSITELDEDTLKLIAAKTFTVDHHKAQSMNHWAIRMKMPSLCLRQVNRAFRWLAPMQEVREKAFEEIGHLRNLYINNTVMCMLNTVKGDMAQGFLQMHTLEKDGKFFHVQMHTEIGMLFHAHEIITKENESTKRVGMLSTMDLPEVSWVDRRERMPEQQEELDKWCEDNRSEVTRTFATVFVKLHDGMTAKSFRMFEDMEQCVCVNAYSTSVCFN